MPVYFIRELGSLAIKIGRASEVKRRVGQLQTGNPSKLELLGWLVTENDAKAELMLHESFIEERIRGEWFSIDQDDVLRELRRNHGFIPKRTDAFEIVGYDRDGIPEYAGVCDWADFEVYECCPFCGCFCGMHQVGEYPLFSCMSCGELTDFSFLEQRSNEA
jgi:hypothetical protein